MPQSLESGSGDRTPRRHAPPEERRAQILEAALACFSDRGYHATTMDHLVKASGLSKGSLYWHFDSKEDVFLGLFDFLAADVFGRFDEAAASTQIDVVTVLRQEMDLFFARFGEERRLLLAWAEFLSHPRGRERMAAIYRVIRTKVADIVRAGIDKGQLRPMSPEGVGAALTGLIDALLLQAAIDPDFHLRDYTDSMWDLVRHGVMPADPSNGHGD